MNYFNYSISYGKGQFYLKSKTQQEGFERVIYGINQDKITFHKYAKSIRGILQSVETKEISHEGKKLQFLEVSFLDGQDLNKVSIPLKTNKGSFTDDVKSIVSVLNGADPKEEYTLTLNKTTTTGKNGKEYKNLNMYLNYVNRQNDQGKGLSTGYIPYTEIPGPEKVEDELLGTSWDWKPVDRFYALKIKEIVEKFNTGTSTPASAAAPTQIAPAPAAAPMVNAMEPDDDDDLPF